MRTSRPFSTISYNTAEFLKLHLDDLVSRGNFSWYAFVKHYAEEDESKDHIHLFIVPDGQIDTRSVSDVLREYDPLHPDKPLKCLPFQSSKFSDWYLYSCHNTEYLASKGQSRKFHYTKEDFVTSEPDYLIEMIHTIDRSKINNVAVVREAAQSGIAFDTLVRSGQIPIPQINQFQKAYDIISQGSSLVRNSPTHSPILDPETGEVIASSKGTMLLPLTDEEERQIEMVIRDEH